MNNSSSPSQWAVRQGTWKLLHNLTGNKLFAGDDNKQKLYLFDVWKDPEEQKNEADEHPEVVKRLSAEYQEWVGDVKIQ